MKIARKLISTALVILTLCSLCVVGMTGASAAKKSTAKKDDLSIVISTNRQVYGTIEMAIVKVTVTNKANKELNNLVICPSSDSLVTMGASLGKKKIDNLAAGESVTHRFPVLLARRAAVNANQVAAKALYFQHCILRPSSFKSIVIGSGKIQSEDYSLTFGAWEADLRISVCYGLTAADYNGVFLKEEEIVEEEVLDEEAEEYEE